MDTYRTLWRISLIIMGITAIGNGLAGSMGIGIPLNVMRIFGVLALCAIPVFVFTSIKLKIWKKEQ